MGHAPDTSADSQAIALEGALTISRLGSAQRAIETAPDPLTIDVSGVERMDTVGAWLLHRTQKQRGAQIVGTSPMIDDLLEQVAEADTGQHKVRPDEAPGIIRMLEEVGVWAVTFGRTARDFLGFFGAVLIGFASLIRHPKRFRLNAVVQRFDAVGVRALGIIGLMSFLIGIVVGQQGAVQLQQFGER